MMSAYTFSEYNSASVNQIFLPLRNAIDAYDIHTIVLIGVEQDLPPQSLVFHTHNVSEELLYQLHKEKKAIKADAGEVWDNTMQEEEKDTFIKDLPRDKKRSPREQYMKEVFHQSETGKRMKVLEEIKKFGDTYLKEHEQKHNEDNTANRK